MLDFPLEVVVELQSMEAQETCLVEARTVELLFESLRSVGSGLIKAPQLIEQRHSTR